MTSIKQKRDTFWNEAARKLTENWENYMFGSNDYRAKVDAEYARIDAKREAEYIAKYSTFGDPDLPRVYSLYNHTHSAIVVACNPRQALELYDPDHEHATDPPEIKVLDTTTPGVLDSSRYLP